MVKKYYKSKRYKQAYSEIAELNHIINNSEIELAIFIKNENWEEAISHQKKICELKTTLLEFGKKGYDIDYRGNYPFKINGL